MCDKRSTVMFSWRKQVKPALAVVAHFRVDPCLREKIRHLWEKGIVTLGSCCGHGKYPETIVIRNKDGFPVEMNQGVVIRRSVRFYRRDAEGFYYIPEVQMYGKGKA